MRHTKKGDLALSTNAIVVLIIAVIVLGLIITFITQGFNRVGDQFFGKVNELPAPPAPTGSRTVTFSEVMVGRPGEEFGMKIAIFNPTTDLITVKPVITCTKTETTPLGASVQVSELDIPSRSSEVFTYIAQLPDTAVVGKNLCTITAEDSGSPVTGIRGELIFEVRD